MFVASLFLALPFLTLNIPNLQSERIPVPSRALRETAKKEIRGIYKKQFAKRDPESRLALAEELLSQAQKSQDTPATHFVLLAEARDAAAESGDVPISYSAIKQMAERYDLPKGDQNATMLGMKLAVLRVVRRKVRGKDKYSILALDFLSLAKQGIDSPDRGPREL